MSHESGTDGVPDIASLAIARANPSRYSSYIKDEDIPPLDIGDSLQLWSSYWKAEDRDRPLSSSSKLQPQPDAKSNGEARTGPKALSQEERHFDDSHKEISGTLQTGLHHSNKSDEGSSTSSSEVAEILTAKVQRIQRVKFVGRAGDGHSADIENAGHSEIPVVHARIINVIARPRPPSPAITAIRVPKDDTDQSTDNDTTVEQPPKIWEDTVAAADEHFEPARSIRRSSASGGVPVAYSEDFGANVDKRRTLREISSQGSVSGRRFASFVNVRNVSRSISPILIDYYKIRRPRTPSVSSHGSQFDQSSPTLAKLSRVNHHTSPQGSPKLNPLSAHVIAQDKLSLRERTVGWLKNVVSPHSRSYSVSAQPGAPGSPRSFKVFSNPLDSIRRKKRQGKVIRPEDIRLIGEHEPLVPNYLGQTGNAASKLALKDVTNLRQPGYLERNSFFKESQAKDPHPLQKPFEAPKGHPNPLASYPPDGSGKFESPLETIRARLEGYAIDDPRPAQPQRPAPTVPHFVSPATAKNIALGDTLAKLEGRASTSQEPLYRRNNRSESDLTSGPNGESREGGPAAGRRSSWNAALEQWKSTVGSVESLSAIQSGDFARARRGLLTTDPTPGAGHWFYEAEKAYRHDHN